MTLDTKPSSQLCGAGGHVPVNLDCAVREGSGETLKEAQMPKAKAAHGFQTMKQDSRGKKGKEEWRWGFISVEA